MGWNTGYTIFESTVIGAYDLGKLDKELLDVLMKPYRHTDIDSGGSNDLESKDGKRVEQIVAETLGVVWPVRPDDEDDDEAMDQYYTDCYDAFRPIMKMYDWG